MSKKYISRKSLVHGKKLKDLKVWILEFIIRFHAIRMKNDAWNYVMKGRKNGCV